VVRCPDTLDPAYRLTSASSAWNWRTRDRGKCRATGNTSLRLENSKRSGADGRTQGL